MKTSLVPLSPTEMRMMQGSLVDKMIELNQSLHSGCSDEQRTKNEIASLGKLSKKVLNYQNVVE